ncbi:unnamed protein product [Hyaloperonospora brassicae]|uniref:ELMO domain-containing protein n=1 Tax=Hyaloperonospora brassicae TaxID=162125 RepID=A0AAV0UTQ1_HYABA|nr:unnamed protein product [Hyaloperonospora brassicae]
MRKRGTMTPASCTLPQEGPVGPAPTQTESSSTAVEDMSSAAPSTPNEDPSSAASSTPVEDMSSATPSTPIEDLSSATSSPVSSPSNSVPCNDIPTAALTGSQGKRMRKRTAEISNERPRKRDKLIVSEEKCRIQTDLAQKLKTFEAKAPWKTVYGNLPVPFDETEYPVLAKKFAQFWRRHSRAVWERNFWAPMSRKLNLADFNRRNNRQFTAKTAFESLIVSVYETFGAAFFVKLDTQKPRHPGWWYYGPVVALFALHQIKGEEAMWEYVTREVLERFPDCKLPVPLTAANSGAIRSRYKGESGSMWMANHYLTTTILREIDELKARQQVCEQS